MVTVSKNKRGRPSVFERDGGEEAARFVFEGLGKRQLVNGHYILEGMEIVEKVKGKGELERLFSTEYGKLKRVIVLEQIGRMSLQDGYSADVCGEIANAAVFLIEKGCKAKAVAQWIRTGRKTGEW